VKTTGVSKSKTQRDSKNRMAN